MYIFRWKIIAGQVSGSYKKKKRDPPVKKDLSGNKSHMVIFLPYIKTCSLVTLFTLQIDVFNGAYTV